MDADEIGRLILAVKSSRYKQIHIAADAGMKPEKLSKILNRKQVPTLPEFIAIARAIRLHPGRLLTDSELVVDIEVLRAVHVASQEVQTASTRLAELVANMLPVPHPVQSSVTALRKEPQSRSVTPVRAAANPNAEFVVELEKQRKRIPRYAWNLGARIIVRVVGDSMDGGDDPIVNGELVFLKPTRSARNVQNRVALVRRDDGLYLKLFEMVGHTIRLVSANSVLPPIVLDARTENLQIYGYVVAHRHE